MWPFDQKLNPKRSYWLLCTFFFFIYILLESNTEKNIFPEKGHFSVVIVKCNRMGPEFLNLYLWIVQILAASSIWELVETGQWIRKTGGVDLVLLVIPRLYRVKKHIWVDICKTFLVYIIEKYDPKNCIIHSTDCIILVFPLYVLQVSEKKHCQGETICEKSWIRLAWKAAIRLTWNILFWDLDKWTVKKRVHYFPSPLIAQFCLQKDETR